MNKKNMRHSMRVAHNIVLRAHKLILSDDRLTFNIREVEEMLMLIASALHVLDPGNGEDERRREYEKWLKKQKRMKHD